MPSSLMSFVEQMTKINRGRVFLSTPDPLGEYILVDYVKQKCPARRPMSAGSPCYHSDP